MIDPTKPPYNVGGRGITDDTSGLRRAVLDALQRDEALLFDQMVYRVSASIPLLHMVRKLGTGSLLRSDDQFYVNPYTFHHNVLYVAVNGDDGNDAVTPFAPVATLRRAFQILQSYGPALNGTWTVQCAAGTYFQGAIDFPVILANYARVTVQGPLVNHPNVPTAIFDGSSSLAYGLNFNSRAYVSVSNLKFQYYTTFGVVSQDIGDIATVNVHVSNVAGGPGIKVQQGRLRVAGGIITACEEGVVSIGNATFTIGDGATSTADATQILNCTQAGIFAQEQSSGHADFCTITNCAVGIDTVERARVHAQQCHITNNATSGVRCRDQSTWFNNGTSQFFSGNTIDEIIYSYSLEVARDNNRTSELQQPIDLTFDTQTGIFSGVVRTYASAIAANSFNATIKGYRAIVYGTITGTTDTKNIVVNLAGSPAWGFTLPAGTEGDFKMEGWIGAFSVDGQQQTFHATMHCGTYSDTQSGSRSINMLTGSAIPMTVSLVVNGAGDTVAIRGVQQFNIGGC